ncbi:MAG TPA: YciI family protein [Streptosporangiales bacterium]
MKYMVLIYGNQATWDALSGRMDEVERAHRVLADELTASGELVGTQALSAVGAQTVRVQDGVPAVTDGPFTEAKELLAGYYLVDCASRERAVEIAARLPEAPYSPIEVRRVMADDEIFGPAKGRPDHA